MRQFGELVSFSETPGAIRGPPPLLGEHTREVLVAAGLDDAAVTELITAGAAVETPVPPPDDYPYGW